MTFVPSRVGLNIVDFSGPYPKIVTEFHMYPYYSGCAFFYGPSSDNVVTLDLIPLIAIQD